MLTAIRNRVTSWVVKLLFAVLIIAFGAWGIGDIFTRQDLGDPVLSVGKATYTALEFRRDLERRLEQMQSQGVTLTAEQFAQLGGVAQIVRQSADRMLLDAFADRIGALAPQSAAIASIQGNPAFAGLGGGFDRDRFVAVLRQNGLGEAGYVEMVRGEMTRQQLLDLAMAGAVAPRTLVDRILAYQGETRTAETLIIPDLSMTDIAPPDAATIQAYYTDHGDSYRRPEYRAGRVLHLRPDDLVDDMTVTEEEIAQEFASRQAEFSAAESRAIEQVVVQEQAMAAAIVAGIAAGKNFADIVKETTGGAPVDLGHVIKDLLPKEIADQAFALKDGAVSAPLKSPFGWHVVHVISVTPATAKTLDQVKDQLRRDLALAKAGDSLVSIVNQLDDALAGGEGLEQAAKALSLTVAEIAAIDAQGKDHDGKAITLAPEVQELLQSTDVGATSQVEALDDGNFAVVQVTSLTPSEVRPISEVERQVNTDWLNNARREAADAQAKALQERLKAVGDLSVLAKEIGQGINVGPPFRRDQDSVAAGIDRALAGTLFALKIGEVAIGRNSDGAVLARLSGIIPAKPDSEVVKALAAEVAKALQADLAQEFLGALEQAIPVERNEEVVQRLIAPQP